MVQMLSEQANRSFSKCTELNCYRGVVLLIKLAAALSSLLAVWAFITFVGDSFAVAVNGWGQKSTWSLLDAIVIIGCIFHSGSRRSRSSWNDDESSCSRWFGAILIIFSMDFPVPAQQDGSKLRSIPDSAELMLTPSWLQAKLGSKMLKWSLSQPSVLVKRAWRKLLFFSGARPNS